MITDQELKKTHEMFADIWRFYKKYCNVKDDESYWQQATDESIQLNYKYPGRLCRSLLVAIMTEFQEIGRGL